MRCPDCTAEVAEDAPSCPACGASLDPSFAETQMLPSEARPVASGGGEAPGRKSSPSRRTHALTNTHDSSIDNARFIAGTMLADRYRIVGLLGRGGMGEVYRAEDLKLSQPVALKFLPESLTTDGAALARFHREVRVARQISHRNVCRVYDIAEAEGLHFLSMEYVKGEELSSVLKRFGRLPADKATEIARQICAGLSAAHEAGVLHRDLKPANVMIDENGNVRIMDFGLAGLADEFRGEHAVEGTPEYMSPEQFTGKELSVKSDIYSLGLVLYEIFTGRKAFTARTLTDLVRLRTSERMPEHPSTLVKNLDPLVERVIERCLASDPKDRPTSALQVAAALPGGDPLQAALAAGETPSPEMVAAASKEGSLRPAVAAGLLAASAAMLLLGVLLSGRVFLHRMVPLEKSTQGLKERGREVVKKFGYEAATDEAFGFYGDVEYLTFVGRNDNSPARWERLRRGQPAALGFWYRRSPRYLVPNSLENVSEADPPHTVSGMAGVGLDTLGRMTYFYGVPQQVVEPQPDATPAPFDWSGLFAEAGLDVAKFRRVEPKWVSPQPFDGQAAWEGVYPEQPDMPVRVEAASFRGRPVHFQLVHPWSRPERQEQFQLPPGQKAVQVTIFFLFGVILVGAALLARRNLRLGRGDRKGALRLGAFTAGLALLIGLTTTHHVFTFDEVELFLQCVAFALMVGGMIWLVYIALEPFVRRRWPTMIIAWNRLLAGDWRDPLVGRDLLIGATFGTAAIVLGYLQYLIPQWLGWPPITPAGLHPGGLLGTQYLASVFMQQVLNSLIFPSALIFLLLLFTIFLRRRWVAAVVLWAIFPVLSFVSGEYPVHAAVLGGIGAAIYIFVLIRFGLLALVFSQFFILMFNFFPVTSDLSAWYAAATIFPLAVAAALLAYAFHTSLAGQRLFKESFVDE